MKRTLIATGALALSLLLVCPLAVQASIEVGDEIIFGNGIGGPGGIFVIDNQTDLAEPNFETFCVELFEFISFSPTKYGVESIGLSTVQSNKPLGTFAAWLYTRFLGVGGTLLGFSASDPLDVNAVQVGIWGDDPLHMGMGYTSAQINPYINAGQHDAALLASLKTQFDSDVANFLWAGTGDIFIMNLRKVKTDGTYGAYAQDQLIRIPPPQQPPVPEPLSVAVWTLLAACAGSISRRSRG
jgi:hypothetical protein